MSIILMSTAVSIEQVIKCQQYVAIYNWSAENSIEFSQESGVLWWSHVTDAYMIYYSERLVYNRDSISLFAWNELNTVDLVAQPWSTAINI